ncbi:MAG: biotin/lipoyl-containing protein [Candidatus Brocadiia bacterium]
MIYKVKMPKIDANVDEGTIGEWLKDEGEEVVEGEPLVEIITDKANFQLEAQDSGFLRVKLARSKDVIPVGYILALMADNMSENLPDPMAENDSIMEQYRQNMLFGGAEDSEPEEAGYKQRSRQKSKDVSATPAARRLAQTYGIDLTEIDTGGRVIKKEDVQELAEQERGET